MRYDVVLTVASLLTVHHLRLDFSKQLSSDITDIQGLIGNVTASFIEVVRLLHGIESQVSISKTMKAWEKAGRDRVLSSEKRRCCVDALRGSQSGQ